MTVSKNNSLKHNATALLALSILASTSSYGASMVFTQDAEDVKVVEEKSTDKNERGPSVGSAANIVPGPYFRKGSIQLPPRPQRQDASTQDEELPLVTGEDEPDTSFQRQAIIEDTLDQLDPSGLAATLDDAEKPPVFWGALDRDTIRKSIDSLHPSGPLPAIHNLAGKFVRNRQILPKPQSDDAIAIFVATRLAALRRFGDGSGYVSLISRLPKDRDWSAIARHRADAALVSGKLVEACTVAAEQNTTTSDAFWLKMNALCYAVDGNRAGVDFQIGILEETTTVSPVFYTLIDQLLIEAELGTSGVEGETTPGMATIDIYQPFPVAILEAAMARLAGATISDLAPADPDPLAIPLLISQPGLNREARIELVELGVKQNWLKADMLKEFVDTLDISSDEEALAFRLYDTDDRFLIDLALARQMANRNNTVDDRMQAFKLGADRATRFNTTAGLAGLQLSLIADIAPNSGLLPYATTVGRLSLLTGNHDLASRWFSLSRALPAGSNIQSDEGLIALWPLMVVSGHDRDIPEVSEATLWKWWRSLEGDESRFDKANRLFTTLDGLSYTITDEVWSWLEAGPSAVSGKAISPAHWRRFLIASSQGQQMAIHLSLVPLFENDETVAPALLGSVVGTLYSRGEEQLARKIALESLLHAGL